LEKVETEMSAEGNKTIDHYKKILERFGSFAEGDLPKAGGEQKDIVQRFGDEIKKQIEMYDSFISGCQLTSQQIRRKWWFLFGSDNSRYVLIPKWRGQPLDLRDIFGGNYIVDRNKFKAALEILIEMNDKRYFEKRLKEIEESDKARARKKSAAKAKPAP
jgi:hypothetical protein